MGIGGVDGNNQRTFVSTLCFLFLMGMDGEGAC